MTRRWKPAGGGSGGMENGRCAYRLWRVALFFSVCLSILVPLGELLHAAESTFGPVRDKLIQDGFPAQQVAKIYGEQPPTPQYKMIATMFVLQESRMNYGQFLDAPSIQRATQFIKENAGSLSQAERTFGVDRTIIAALLLVETNFGKYTGRTPTLAILSTYALMDQKSYRDRVWALLPLQDRERWGRDAFDEKLIRRGNWAYQELCALIRWSDGQSAKLKNLQGSLMGAVGMPQFIPSNVERYGVDGNRNGRTDLFEAPDAISSIAFYLQSLGWSAKSSPAEQEEIIYQYNHSRPYVRTVLDIAARLRSELAASN
jgi:membrane-bound lytic murein transglycosylase B